MNCLAVCLRFIGEMLANNLDNKCRQFTQMKVVRTCVEMQANRRINQVQHNYK